MKFTYAGKAYQLVIRDGNDLQDALQLDEALWVAMSAPNKAYTCEPKFLAYVDTDNNGSITSSEIKNAIKWLLDVYPKKEKINDNFSGKLQLEDINVESANGKAIEHSAKYILNDLKIENNTEIDLATVRNFQAILTSRPLNGDGVMTVSVASECKDAARVEDMRAFIQDGVAALGGTKDLDGTMGLTLAQFNEFWAAIPQYLGWLKQAEIPAGETTTPIMTFGADTPSLMALLDENGKLIDDYFELCALQDYDQRLAGQMLNADGNPGVVDTAKWPGLESHLKAMPIQQPEVGAALCLNNPALINPLYRYWLSLVTTKIITPVLGEKIERLDKAGWQEIKGRFAAYRAYLAAKVGGCCAAIPVDRLERYVTMEDLPALAADLSERDLVVTKVLEEVSHVEKLLLFLQLLVRLCNNFISFPDLYNPQVPTLFERGRVVLDGRWFNVTFPVDNLAAHSAAATASGLFIIYIEIDTKPAPTILAAPVTIGDKGALAVGKRGIFFDYKGVEYNAKIVKVLENPVCLKEALLAPFTRFGKMVENKVSKMSSASDATLQKKMQGMVDQPKAALAATAATAQQPAAANTPAAQSGAGKGGMLMGIGVAFAALSSALAFVCKTLASMSAISILVSLACVLAVLLLPILMLGILRLRRQDLSSLLEGNGWAINSRMRLSRHQRRTFSRNGRFEKGAIGSPMWRLRRAITWVVVVILLALLCTGAVYCWKHCCTKVECEDQNSQVTVVTPEADDAAAKAATAAKDAAKTVTPAPAATPAAAPAKEAPATK